MQCPKCREIVDLGPKKTAPPAITALPPAPPGEMRAPLSKIEALEARIAALEAAALATAPVVPIEITLQRPEKTWRWTARSDAHEAEKLATPLAEVLLHNLRNFDRQTLTIRATAGSATALARAAGLREIFERAGWTVEGPVEVPARGSDAGLFLAVGALPLPPAASAAYFAMSASGFTLNSFLDPKIAGTGTILIVA